MRWFVLLVLAFGLCSCAYVPRRAVAPVPTLTFGPEEAEELIVLLPGRFSRPEEFVKTGFLDQVRHFNPKARVEIPDLHLTYYIGRSVDTRLEEDIIIPARERGVKKISLVGISMGGLGSLLHAVRKEDRVDEIVMLSPFAGKDKVIEEITRAGGLAEWEAPDPLNKRDYSRLLWRELQDKWGDESGRPELYLGCGTSDDLLSAARLLEREFVPAENVVYADGGHDWPTWVSLYREIELKKSGRRR